MSLFARKATLPMSVAAARWSPTASVAVLAAWRLVSRGKRATRPPVVRMIPCGEGGERDADATTEVRPPPPRGDWGRGRRACPPRRPRRRPGRSEPHRRPSDRDGLRAGWHHLARRAHSGRQPADGARRRRLEQEPRSARRRHSPALRALGKLRWLGQQGDWARTEKNAIERVATPARRASPPRRGR